MSLKYENEHTDIKKYLEQIMACDVVGIVMSYYAISWLWKLNIQYKIDHNCGKSMINFSLKYRELCNKMRTYICNAGRLPYAIYFEDTCAHSVGLNDIYRIDYDKRHMQPICVCLSGELKNDIRCTRSFTKSIRFFKKNTFYTTKTYNVPKVCIYNSVIPYDVYTITNVSIESTYSSLGNHIVPLNIENIMVNDNNEIIVSTESELMHYDVFRLLEGTNITHVNFKYATQFLFQSDNDIFYTQKENACYLVRHNMITNKIQKCVIDKNAQQVCANENIIYVIYYDRIDMYKKN